jgi:pimeloyl-ACP methyl ester carboxylesterase
LAGDQHGEAPEGHTSSLGDTAAAWATTHRVLVDGWNIRYRFAGCGPPVVLVHGLGVSADYWTRNAIPIAATGFCVYAPDLPGFGRTAGPADGLSIPEQAAAVAAWAGAMGIGTAVYMGHSLSAQVVLELTATQPDRVRGLVLIAPTGAPGPRMLRQAWRLFLDAWREPWSLLTTAGVAYLRAGPRRYWGTWRAGAEHHPLDLLPEIRTPALVVVGSRDPVVERDFAATMASDLPGGHLAVIEGGSHAVQTSRPDAFNRVAISFLRTLMPW